MSREVSFDAVARCEHCNGNGAEPGTPIQTCETCGGQGAVQQVVAHPVRPDGAHRGLPDLQRRGQDPRRAVQRVRRRRARRSGRRTWDVDVPAGIEDGQRIRIAGAGHAGEHGAPAGDLYVEVRVAPDERFERHGEHLVSVARDRRHPRDARRSDRGADPRRPARDRGAEGRPAGPARACSRGLGLPGAPREQARRPARRPGARRSPSG